MFLNRKPKMKKKIEMEERKKTRAQLAEMPRYGGGGGNALPCIRNNRHAIPPFDVFRF
jgi:hypothetical protein